MLPLVLAVVFLMPSLGDSPPEYQRPVDAASPPYIELLERNTHIVYPVLAVVVLALVVAGILQAWRTQDLDGLQKAELKREIILELRKDTVGSSVESLARHIKLDQFKLMKLLEEMQTDGLVASATNTQRLTTWRLKGVGPGKSSVRR